MATGTHLQNYGSSCDFKLLPQGAPAQALPGAPLFLAGTAVFSFPFPGIVHSASRAAFTFHPYSRLDTIPVLCVRMPDLMSGVAS